MSKEQLKLKSQKFQDFYKILCRAAMNPSEVSWQGFNTLLGGMKEWCPNNREIISRSALCQEEFTADYCKTMVKFFKKELDRQCGLQGPPAKFVQ